MKNIFHYDLIIIGAGIVGMQLACEIAETGLQIAILDHANPESNSFSDSEQYDKRVFAITRASQSILQQLDVWQEIVSMRVSPYKQMHVWDSTGKGRIEFDCQEVGEPNLGHIIESRVIQSALVNKIKQYENIKLIYSTKLDKLQRQELNISLLAEDSIRYISPLVIGADGANSWLRKNAGINLRTRPYGHEAIVATVKTSISHGQVARQCFMEDGPLAFLPLSEKNTSSIVWSTVPEYAHELKGMSEDEFKKVLAESFANCLGDIVEISERVSFPLHMRHAEQYVNEGIALIGDSAHTVHPLAGQGLNLGILDAHELANVIKNSLQKNRSYHSKYTLRAYERQRKAHNQGMIALMDGFKTLFGSKQSVIKLGRNFGLNLTNKLVPIKRQIIRQAMGARTTEFG